MPMDKREYNRLRARMWRREHPDKAAAIASRYYQAHKAEIQARKKAKRQKAN